MSRFYSLPSNRWAYLLIVVLLSCSHLYHHSIHQPNRGLSGFLSQEREVENLYQARAVHILQGLGESKPVVEVSVCIDRTRRETQQISPDPLTTVVESEQSTSESMAPAVSEKPYRNDKRAVNYRVAETRIKSVSTEPELTRVHCLAQVSTHNAQRAEEIERALFVALGMKAERGDSVMVMVR